MSISYRIFSSKIIQPKPDPTLELLNAGMVTFHEVGYRYKINFLSFSDHFVAFLTARDCHLFFRLQQFVDPDPNGP
jgi:hypothetical protein